MKKLNYIALTVAVCAMVLILPPMQDAFGLSDAYKGNVYQTGPLKPTDSRLKVKVGEKAPGFTLPAVSGSKVSLADY